MAIERNKTRTIYGQIFIMKSHIGNAFNNYFKLMICANLAPRLIVLIFISKGKNHKLKAMKKHLN